MRCGPMSPQMMEAEKKTWPLGQVKCCFWVCVQTWKGLESALICEGNGMRCTVEPCLSSILKHVSAPECSVRDQREDGGGDGGGEIPYLFNVVEGKVENADLNEA